MPNRTTRILIVVLQLQFQFHLLITSTNTIVQHLRYMEVTTDLGYENLWVE